MDTQDAAMMTASAYIYDLLVKPSCRGAGLGRLLMEKVCSENSESTVYVMSDVDIYYQKLGYHKEGSIFIVTPPNR